MAITTVGLLLTHNNMQNDYLKLALDNLGETFNDYNSGRFVAQQLIKAQVPSPEGTRWDSSPANLIKQMHHLLGVLQATPGDLLFWGTQNAPYEMGIYVGGNQFIAVDNVDHVVKIQPLSKSWYPCIAGSAF
ncbi:NlpC/P60 family protein [Leuconostoc koreense]|nr:NlpC/P60 family protein [Leuconostoc mesenteroides]QGM25177.1 hydrolase [Leuconostoc mesenteroides subsp. mesenteroides]